MDSNHSNFPEGIGSDRLQKAIVRNRDKLGRKSEMGPAPMASFSSTSNKLWNLKSSGSPPPAPPKAPIIHHMNNGSLSKRQSVATVDNVKFTNGLSDVTKNKKSMLGKNIFPKSFDNSPVKRISDKTGINWTKFMVVAGWCFCLFLLLRLIFAQRGVMDYYSRKASFHRKEMLFRQLIVENNSIEKEIKLMQDNYQYQKQLVRDHLGFIAKDEHLILFDSNP